MKADFSLLKVGSEGSSFHHRALLRSCPEVASMEAMMLPGEAVAGHYILQHYL